MPKSVFEQCAASAETAGREVWPQTDGLRPEVVVRLDLVGDAVRLIRAIECGGESVVEVEAGTMVAVLQDWSEPFPGFVLYYPKQRQMSSALRAFVDMLRE